MAPGSSERRPPGRGVCGAREGASGEGGRPPGRPGPARPPSRQSRPAPRSPETASLTRSSRKCQIEIIRPQGQGPPGPPHWPAMGLRVSRALGGAASEERRLSPVGSAGLRAIAFGNVPARPSARTRSPLPAGAPPAPTPLPPPPDLSPIFSILCPGTCGTVAWSAAWPLNGRHPVAVATALDAEDEELSQTRKLMPVARAG